MKRLVVGIGLTLLLASAGCKKQEQQEGPAATSALKITEVELQRGRDACKAYEEAACALAKRQPERKEAADECALAPSLADAMRTALEIAQYPDSSRRDVLQAQDSVRKTVKTCLDGVARLANQ